MSMVRLNILFALPFLWGVAHADKADKPATVDPTFAMAEARARMKPVLIYVYDTR